MSSFDALSKLPKAREDDASTALATSAGKDGILIDGKIHRTLSDWRKLGMRVDSCSEPAQRFGMILYGEHQVWKPAPRVEDLDDDIPYNWS